MLQVFCFHFFFFVNQYCCFSAESQTVCLEHLISVHLSELRHLVSEYALLFSSAIKITFVFLLLFLRINIY